MRLVPERAHEADLKLVYGVDVGEAASACAEVPPPSILFERARKERGTEWVHRSRSSHSESSPANARGCANLPDKAACHWDCVVVMRRCSREGFASTECRLAVAVVITHLRSRPGQEGEADGIEAGASEAGGPHGRQIPMV